MNDEESNEPSYREFGAPYRALIDHLEENGLAFKSDPGSQRITLRMCRQHALYYCSLQIKDDGGVFQMYIDYPVLAKDERLRAAAAEFVARANYGLVVGNFELDMRDGEVRYHVGHVLSDARLEDGMIGKLFGTALSTADRYFPAFMLLLFGGNTAEDAVYLAELDMHSEHVEQTPDATEPPASQKSAKSQAAAKPQKKKSPAPRKKKSSAESENRSEKIEPADPAKGTPPASGEIKGG